MKDPAFLFYSSDFLSGVADLTMEERGQFITLLCLQHQKGELSEKTIRLAVGSVSVDVMDKFRLTENKTYINDRLDKEIENRRKFVESRRENGKKGGRKKEKEDVNPIIINDLDSKEQIKPLGYPTVNLMGNENENENINTNKNKNGIETIKTPPFLKNENEEICVEVLTYLNELSGRKLDVNNKFNHTQLLKRIKEGNSIEDFKLVVELKSYQWKDSDDMRKFLHPDTLFNKTKFEKYKLEINEAKSNPTTFRKESLAEQAARITNELRQRSTVSGSGNY